MTNRVFTKIEPDEADWPLLYEVVSACGKSHTPRSFYIDVLNNIGRVCPYDQALIYILDGNQKVIGRYLNNFREDYSDMYLTYYKDVDDKFYSGFNFYREIPTQPTINVHDWLNEDSPEFIPQYVRMMGLRYTVGTALFDLLGNVRAVIALDRIHLGAPTNRELYNLQLLLQILNDFHKNFFYQEKTLDFIGQDIWEEGQLTAREIEVVDLLAQGVSPANISKSLYISQSTTYKHIAHIYEKLGVKSQQELLVKLLRQVR